MNIYPKSKTKDIIVGKFQSANPHSSFERELGLVPASPEGHNRYDYGNQLLLDHNEGPVETDDDSGDYFETDHCDYCGRQVWDVDRSGKSSNSDSSAALVYCQCTQRDADSRLELAKASSSERQWMTKRIDAPSIIAPKVRVKETCRTMRNSDGGKNVVAVRSRVVETTETQQALYLVTRETRRLAHETTAIVSSSSRNDSLGTFDHGDKKALRTSHYVRSPQFAVNPTSNSTLYRDWSRGENGSKHSQQLRGYPWHTAQRARDRCIAHNRQEERLMASSAGPHYNIAPRTGSVKMITYPHESKTVQASGELTTGYRNDILPTFGSTAIKDRCKDLVTAARFRNAGSKIEKSAAFSTGSCIYHRQISEDSGWSETTTKFYNESKKDNRTDRSAGYYHETKTGTSTEVTQVEQYYLESKKEKESNSRLDGITQGLRKCWHTVCHGKKSESSS